MSITSVPSDRDDIVFRETGGIGGESFIASKALLAFFDDLVNEISSTTDEKKNFAILSSALIRASSMRTELDKAKKEIDVANQMLATMSVMIGALSKKQADIDQRLKNVEQTAWR